MNRVSVNLLLMETPVQQAARHEALLLVRRANKACARLARKGDEEALHDFRVALRRLRTWLRAYRAYLPVSGKVNDRLRSLAQSTGDARDAEVGLEWLQKQRPVLGTAEQVGVDWLSKQLSKRKAKAYKRIRKTAPRSWPALEEKLMTQLHTPGSFQVDHPAFADVCTALLKDTRGRLEAQLAKVRGAEDIEAAHRARIYAKRLRYLIEPLQQLVPGAEPAVAAFKAMQDLLGEMHDCDVLLADLRPAIEVAAVEHAQRLWTFAVEEVPADDQVRVLQPTDPVVGLVGLARRAKQRRDELFAEIQERYVQNGPETVVSLVREVEDGLGATAQQVQQPDVGSSQQALG